MMLLGFILLAFVIVGLIRIIIWLGELPSPKCDICGSDIGTNGDCQDCRGWWR